MVVLWSSLNGDRKIHRGSKAGRPISESSGRILDSQKQSGNLRQMHQMQVRGTESGHGAVTEVGTLQGQRSGTSVRQEAKTLSLGEGTDTRSMTKRNQRRKTEG